jgi:hypothetical protein
MDEAYLEILRMVESGTISAEEAEMLWDALEAGSEQVIRTTNGTATGWEVMADQVETWSPKPPDWAQQAWLIPLTGGVLLVALAGMANALLMGDGSRLGWLACTLPLMLLGALVIALAWWSRTDRWLHVRVRNHDTRFRISLPLPLRPVAWLARLVRPFVPQMHDIPVDEMILALAEMEEEGMLGVEVNDDDGGEVQVCFG